MSIPTVYAVMKVVIEIPVRPSSAGETIEQLYEVARKEAEGRLRNKLDREFRVIGNVEFSHAVIKES